MQKSPVAFACFRKASGCACKVRGVCDPGYYAIFLHLDAAELDQHGKELEAAVDFCPPAFTRILAVVLL